MTKDRRKYTLEEDQNTCHMDTQNSKENDEIKNIVIAVENSNTSSTWTPAEVITKTKNTHKKTPHRIKNCLSS